MIVASFVLWGFVYSAMGGWDGVALRLETVESGLSDQLLQVGGYGPEGVPPVLVVFGFLVVLTTYVLINQYEAIRFLGARSEWDFKMAVVVASLATAVCLFFNVTLGPMARAEFPDLAVVDEAYPRMIVEYLPAGLVGLVVAGLVAAGLFDLRLHRHRHLLPLRARHLRPLPGAPGQRRPLHEGGAHLGTLHPRPGLRLRALSRGGHAPVLPASGRGHRRTADDGDPHGGVHEGSPGDGDRRPGGRSAVRRLGDPRPAAGRCRSGTPTCGGPTCGTWSCPRSPCGSCRRGSMPAGADCRGRSCAG